MADISKYTYLPIKRNQIGRFVSRPGYDVISNSERAPKGEVVEKIILYPDGAPSGRLPIWQNP